ncbi:MAG: HXXEE domain-containing protein [Candidatus Saccharimonadales bacterium]
MKFLRNHWFHIGFVVAILFSTYLLSGLNQLSSFRILISISFVGLLLHQFEEYVLPGHFPRMINTVMFHSKTPNRYPLNPNTALIINVLLGWLLYILAIIFADHAVWLAVTSIMISIGNVVAHTFLFNIKGKTLYNPGMATALGIFLPTTIIFFQFVIQTNLLDVNNFIIGLVLGIILNYFGVLKMITLLGKKNTPYHFK